MQASFWPRQDAHLQWTRDRARGNWEEFVRYQVRANETYSQAKRQLSDRILISGGPLLRVPYWQRIFFSLYFFMQLCIEQLLYRMKF